MGNLPVQWTLIQKKTARELKEKTVFNQTDVYIYIYIYIWVSKKFYNTFWYVQACDASVPWLSLFKQWKVPTVLSSITVFGALAPGNSVMAFIQPLKLLGCDTRSV